MSDVFIPLSVPNLKGNELEYVTNAVESEWVSTAGSYVADFEKKVADYVGANDAVACQSGTAGIHVALRLLGVRPGDLVLAPALTFIAAVNPIRYLGADPVFMDCDQSLCIDPEKVREFCVTECSFSDGVLTHNASGRPISAMVVVHVFGNMANMPELLEIADEYNLPLLEDATEALGTYYTDGPLAGKYAGTMGDMGVFSFNGNKIITTGGGGMIVSSDQDLLDSARHLTTQAKSDPVRFEHDEIGFNYRLTNLQAALGLAQMEQIETFIETKNDNYDHYKNLLKDLSGFKLFSFQNGIRSNKWFYSLECDPEVCSREELMELLGSKGIQTRPIWGLICDQTPYEGSLVYKIERARYYRDRILNLPCSTNLLKDDIERVVNVIIAEDE